MACLKSSLLKLATNSKDVFDEATRLLIKIADNILKEPTNLKIRALQKCNHTISKKILSIPGGLECLKCMGFEESSVSLVLPPGASLNSLQTARNEISNYRKDCLKRTKNDESVKQSSEEGENAFAGLLQHSVSPNPLQSVDGLSSSGNDSDSSTASASCDASRGAVPKVLAQPEETKCDSIKRKQIIVPHDVPRVKLLPLDYMFTNPFLQSVEMAFHMAQAYSDKALQERARLLIPMADLEIAAQKRLRILQEQLKSGNSGDLDVSLQDMLLLELLAWFKIDFFSWVNSPECVHCGGATKFIHMSNDRSLMVHTERVEMHKCDMCQQMTPFHRYNDVNILLITRRGRCGEWANTFTLMCCAMGWDARHVIDQGDHVWTEVYSFAQKRWLHCDPCENVCDTPLMYESGWGKKLSYVMAYSTEEVQDVSWRYSSHHKVLLSRRNLCTEMELIDAMIKFREYRQKNLTPARKQYLTKRLLIELVDLTVERKPREADKQGRTSGSLAWRVQRGEIRNIVKSYCWRLAQDDTDVGDVTVRYSAALDKYEYVLLDGTVKTSLSEWHSGAFAAINIFRKVENDWKKAYLARREGAESGMITWRFALENAKKVMSVLDIRFDHQIFENGKAEIQIQGDKATVNFPANVSQLRTSALLGSKSVAITARLSGGRGSVAWQHAQLFRQSTDSKEHPFSIKFSFKPVGES